MPNFFVSGGAALQVLAYVVAVFALPQRDDLPPVTVPVAVPAPIGFNMSVSVLFVFFSRRLDPLTVHYDLARVWALMDPAALLGQQLTPSTVCFQCTHSPRLKLIHALQWTERLSQSFSANTSRKPVPAFLSVVTARIVG